jgi:hypothetical protein
MESEIQEFYEKNKNAFYSEEARNFTYIVIDKKSVKNDSTVDGSGERDYSQGFDKITSEILDMLAAERSLEDIANQLNLKIDTIRQVTKLDDEKIRHFPKVDGLIDTVFSLEEGLSSDLLENEKGDLFVVVRLDSIIEKRVKALDEVRPQVEKLWTQKEKEKRLEEFAKKISEELIEGKITMAEAASQNGLKLEQVEEIYRDYPDLPQAFLNEIFMLNKKGYTNPYKLGSDKYLIAKINKIAEEEKIDEMAKLELKVNIQEQVQQEIYSQYLAYLSTKYRVKTNTGNKE